MAAFKLSLSMQSVMYMPHRSYHVKLEQADKLASFNCSMQSKEGTFCVLNRVLGIQYLDSRRAFTLFLLLRRLSPEGTMSTRLTRDLGCNWTDWVSPQSALILEIPSSNGKI